MARHQRGRLPDDVQWDGCWTQIFILKNPEQLSLIICSVSVPKQQQQQTVCPVLNCGKDSCSTLRGVHRLFPLKGTPEESSFTRSVFIVRLK